MKLATNLFAAFVLLSSPMLAHADEFARGRVLVTSTVSDSQLETSVGKHKRLGKSNVHVLYVEGDEKQAIEKMKGKHGVVSVELDKKVKLSAIPNDPYFGSQWHLTRVGAPSAWDSSLGTNIVIAILDSGVDGNHPDLVANMVPGYNTYDNNTDSSDVYGHGTAVAGVAAASFNNATGVAGVAGNAKIMPIRVSDTTGYAYYSTIASGLTWAADRGAKVANASFGGVSGSSAVQSAANYFKSKGGVVFVSAGNANSDDGAASSTSLVTVAATDESDNRAYFSSFGAAVSLSAPGTNIQTTDRFGGYSGWNGTSFSSPLAAGVAALMLSVNPKLTPDQVQNMMYSTAVDLGTAGKDVYFGWGRVDAAAAVEAAKSAVVAPVTPVVTDTTPPTISLSYKYRSQGGGQVVIDSQARDANAVTQKLYIDNTLVTSGGSFVSYTWNMRRVATGTHYIKSTAVDAAGNSTSTTITYVK